MWTPTTICRRQWKMWRVLRFYLRLFRRFCSDITLEMHIIMTQQRYVLGDTRTCVLLKLFFSWCRRNNSGERELDVDIDHKHPKQWKMWQVLRFYWGLLRC